MPENAALKKTALLSPPPFFFNILWRTCCADFPPPHVAFDLKIFVN